MKNKYFWPLVIIGSLVVAIILNVGESSHNITYLMGSATGFIVFPAIITLVISGLMRLNKKKMGDREFNNAFLVIWGIMIAFYLLGSILV